MDTNARRLKSNFLIELVVYGILVGIYFVLVLRTMGDWLTALYYENLTLYAFVALALIVTQAVVVEMVTTVAAKRHRTLGHVDFKLGFVMVSGTVVGVEIGAQLIELLKSAGSVDLAVGIS